MGTKTSLIRIAVTIPGNKTDKRIVEKLIKIGKNRDRSVNYLVIEALEQYLELQEAE